MKSFASLKFKQPFVSVANDGKPHTDAELNQSGGLTTARVEALSDGVFAIAMTLLILDFHIPKGLTSGDFHLQLFYLWPTLVTYILSFVVLGSMWIGHHNQFYWIKYSNRKFLWINIAFLGAIAFIPFSTTLLGTYSTQKTAVFIYGINLIVTGFLLYYHWAYATYKHRLVAVDLNHSIIRIVKARILLGAIFYLIGMAAAFVSTKISIAIFLLIQLTYIMPSRIDQLLRYELGPQDHENHEH